MQITTRSISAILTITLMIVTPHLLLQPSAQAQPKTLIGKTQQSPYVSFPTAGVKLIQPDGFAVAESFDGFQQPNTQSSVLTMMIPGPFAETTKGFTAAGLKTRGMTLRSKENISIEGQTGLLINLVQTVNNTEFSKWIVVFGNQQETKMVTATFPTANTAKLSAPLKSVVLTAKNDLTSPQLGANVGFTIAAANKLKITRGMGKTLMYTKDGVVPVKSRLDPLFLVAPSLSQVTIVDRQKFATDRLAKTGSIKIDAVTTTNPITIDGLDGYEIIADAQDAAGTALTLYQVMLFEDKSYLLIQGIVGTKIRDEYLPEFKAMARSFKKQR
jgi:hypothetical protein